MEIVLCTAGRNKKDFVLKQGRKPWGYLFAASKGSFKITLPASGTSTVFAPYEFSYVPPDTEFIREVISPLDYYQIAFNLDRLYAYTPTITGKLNIPPEQVRAILNSMEQIFCYPAELNELSIQIIERILTDNYLFSNGNTSRNIRFSPEIRSAIEYISEHLNEKITVSSLAQMLHLSHNGLIWKFKKELKTTPSEYITHTRITKAKQLLSDGTLTLSQISEACGYANAYYFSNAFKKAEGIRPIEFRKKHVW